MRKAGFKTVLYEAGTSFGGTWRWNIYPGEKSKETSAAYTPNDTVKVLESTLRFPSTSSVYQRSIRPGPGQPNYPDWHELQAYFDHVDKVCGLSKDCAFESVVTSSEFDKESGKWTVKTADGRTANCKYLLVAAGFAAKRYIPDLPGMDKFKGFMAHSSFWPPEGVDARGKRVAVIGTGASGVQIIQEWGSQVEHMTVFQRTPNLALPMGKRDLTKQEQEILYPAYDELLRMREKNFAGFTYDFAERNTFEDTPEEREALYEQLWTNTQGFGLWLGSHKDYLFDFKANRCVYDFWRKKQMARIRNPEKQAVLCPEEPPHPFGVKRTLSRAELLRNLRQRQRHHRGYQ